MPEQNTYQEISQKVVRHYRKHRRDLPWRCSSDAYRVWISEIMLQQTRVTTVIPYFDRWLRTFPTIDVLANANLDEVLAHWSGLGYYSRARNIHACAREVVSSYGGRLPSAARELRKLPGIGRYTAGAVSSIAYGQHEALVDGNVARIVSRLFALDDEIKSSTAVKKHWGICEKLVPAYAPGDFNQGLMELGALICTPQSPRCPQCPLRGCCLAHKKGRTNELPVVSKRKRDSEKPLLSFEAVYAERGAKLLLAKRSEEGLFGGLWELPQCLDRESLPALTGLGIQFARKRAQVRHEQVLSHRRLLIRVWSAKVSGRTKLVPGSPYERLSWYSPNALTGLGISSATRAILSQRHKLQIPRQDS